MDRVHRIASTVGPLKVILVAFALVLIVPFGARIGDAAQSDPATPGAFTASPDASPAATPSASPIASANGELGSITVRVLACDEATSAESLDPTACDKVSGDVQVEISGDTGEPLTVDDSLRLSGGVFRWSRIPFGTYTVALSALPDGATTALATAGDAGTPEDITSAGLDVTIDASESSLTIAIYLLPSSGA